MNKWKIFVLLILVSCSANKNFVSIDSGNHATIEVLEKNYSRSFGSGKLIGKGKSNFSSNFFFRIKRRFLVYCF